MTEAILALLKAMGATADEIAAALAAERIYRATGGDLLLESRRPIRQSPPERWRSHPRPADERSAHRGSRRKVSHPAASQTSFSVPRTLSCRRLPAARRAVNGFAASCRLVRSFGFFWSRRRCRQSASPRRGRHKWAGGGTSAVPVQSHRHLDCGQSRRPEFARRLSRHRTRPAGAEEAGDADAAESVARHEVSGPGSGPTDEVALGGPKWHGPTGRVAG
jgi:hypothetical protein